MRLGRKLVALFFCVCVVFSCADVYEPQDVRTQFQAVGEPVGDYPSWDERLMLYLTNRARSEPDAFNPGEPYPASAPVRWDYDLSRAARFHAQHIVEASCWCMDHSSCCELGSVGGEVSCTSAVTGCGAFDTASRVALFSPNYAGENMAQGHRGPAEAIEGWIFSSGHWANINTATHTLLGVGQYQGARVQNFGRGGGPVRPVAEDGIHFSSGSSTTFGINYYQPGSGGPQSILAIVNGECHDLNLAYGQPEHGAFERTMNLSQGCHRYYFHVTDGNGEHHVYPSTGSLGVSVGGAECPLFAEERPADTCSPSGQTCETGHTRSCWTGPFGMRDVGICRSGTERCIGGQWTGECRNEVHPEPEEICGNELDDTCTGVVDDGCPDGPLDEPVDPIIPGNEPIDPGDDPTPGGASKPDPDGCSTAPTGNGLWLSVMAVLFVAWRRRRGE